MKGVILAGGLATRLYPLTHATNKHLLPIYDKPMIFYPIKTLVDAGITEILIVVSGPHSGHFINILKNGKELGVKHLEYAYQENPKGGIADALALAEDFADGGDIAVILGDNTTDADIKNDVATFQTNVLKKGAKLFLKQVPDPERFGVAEFHEFPSKYFDQPKVKVMTRIIEKPKKAPTNLAVTGLYLYDNTVFHKIKQLSPSKRGELEITDVNNMYLKVDRLTYKVLGQDEFWSDAGTFETLYQANRYWQRKAQTAQPIPVVDKN